MKPIVKGNIDHELARFPWYRPPDPSWANQSVIERVRVRLHNIDPKLDIWWNSDWRPDDEMQPGRWAIMYWMQRAHLWSIVKYWEGALGGFRELEVDCCQEIADFLGSIDASKQGNDVHSINRMADEINAERKAKRMRETIDRIVEVKGDEAKRRYGVRQTFGRNGLLRSRRFLRGGS